MRRNISLIMVFLFGCATAKMVEYVSFQDAVAKTGSRCHYTLTSWGVFGTTGGRDKKPSIEYEDEAKMLLSKKWKVHTLAGQYALWEKCK